MTKYYRVKQDNFLWEKGAILKQDGSGYTPIEDIWDKTEFNGTEYISTKIIESQPEWFERVYTDNVEKMVFKTKEQLKELFGKLIS